MSYSCDVTSGAIEHEDYWPCIDTGRILDGIPLWATADCRPDPAPPSGDINHPFDPVPNSGTHRAIYRMASFTNRRLDGIPLMAAEIDPCCDGGFAIGGPNSGGGGGGSGPNVVTCFCGSSHGVPQTLYLVGGTGSITGVHSMIYQGNFTGAFPAESCDVWSGSFSVSGTTYVIKLKICQSPFGCNLLIEFYDASGTTLICRPNGVSSSCPPLMIEIRSDVGGGDCVGTLGVFDSTIVETSP